MIQFRPVELNTIRRTLAAHAPSSAVLAAILMAAAPDLADDETVGPGRLDVGDARRVLAANSTESAAAAVVRHCPDQNLLSELTRRAIDTGAMPKLVRALLASPAISVFDVIELARNDQGDTSFHMSRIVEAVNAASPTPELFAHAAQLRCQEVMNAIAAHPDLAADTAMAVVRHAGTSGPGPGERHPFLNHMAAAPVAVFSRPTTGSGESLEQLTVSLRELAATCDPALHYFDRVASFGHKVFNYLAKAPDLNRGEEYLDDQIAEILCSHNDGRQALLARADTPPSACRWLWEFVRDLPSDTGTDQWIDNLTGLPGCPDDVLDEMPADAGGGVALVRRLPPDPVTWQVAVTVLETAADRNSVPSVAEVRDVAMAVSAKA